MMSARQRLLAIYFCCFLPLCSYAEAPVVDDSENFAILDEQQAALEQPVTKSQYNDDDPYQYNDNLDEIPLAKEESLNQGGNVKLLDKIQGMQQEIQELRGQLEVQAHTIKQLQQQQLAFYKDLDARMQNSSAAKSSQATTSTATTLSIDDKKPNQPSVPVASTSAATATSKPAIQAVQVSPPPVITKTAETSTKNNPAEEQISYLAAYDLVKTKRYDAALTAMQAFANQYPHGGYTSNAQYWLGELYMVKKNYPQAIEHFEIVLKQFPNSNKSAASTLKIGYAYVALGRHTEAKQRLQQVLKNYPDTLTAQLAYAKLKSLSAT